MSSNKTVYILNRDPQIEANKQKTEENALTIQNITNSDDLISVNFIHELPYSVKEGTYAFVKNMGTVASPEEGKPLYFHDGKWFDFCCSPNKTAKIDRNLSMVVVYVDDIKTDKLLVEYDGNSSFKDLNDDSSVFDISDQTDNLNKFLKEFIIKYSSLNPSKNIGLYVTNNLSNVDMSDYSIYPDQMDQTNNVLTYAIFPKLDNTYNKPNESVIISDTNIALLEGLYDSDTLPNDHVYYFQFGNGTNGAQKLHDLINSVKEAQYITFDVDQVHPDTNPDYNLDHEYEIPNVTQKNISVRHSLLNNQNGLVTITNNKLSISKPVSNLKPVTIRLEADGDAYYQSYLRDLPLSTFDENNLVAKNETELQNVFDNQNPSKGDVYKYTSNNDKIVYFDGTDFRYLDDDELVLVSEKQIKIIMKYSVLGAGLADEILPLIQVPNSSRTFEIDLADSKEISLSGQTLNATINYYTPDIQNTTSIDHTKNDNNLNIYTSNGKLFIEESHEMLNSTIFPENDTVILTVTLIPNFNVNFGVDDKSKLNNVVNNWDTNSVIRPSKFTFNGLTDMSGIFNKNDYNPNNHFPWEETENWSLVDITDMSDMFVNYTDTDFKLPEKEAITDWWIPRPISEALIQDLEAIIVILYGNNPNPDQISYAWAELLSESSTLFSGLSWNIKKVASIHEKVARYLLGGDYMSGYNFGPIEDWDVSNVKEMSGLFGVTEVDGWSSSKTYETGDLVNYQSNIYRAVNLSGGTNKNKVPSHAPHRSHPYFFWEKVEGLTNYIDEQMKTAIQTIVSDLNSDSNTTNNTTYSEVRDLLKEKLASFNKDLSKWDVSNVNTFYRTFYHLPEFNQPLFSGEHKWVVNKKFSNNPNNTLQVGDILYMMGKDQLNAITLQILSKVSEEATGTYDARTRYTVFQSTDYKHNGNLNDSRTQKRYLYIYDNGNIELTNIGKSYEKAGILENGYIRFTNTHSIGQYIYRSLPIFKDMFRNAESMSGNIDFVNFISSTPTQYVSPKYYSDIFTGSNASFIVSDYSKFLSNYTSGGEYAHDDYSIRYFAALDVSKNLGVDSNNVVHRVDTGNPNEWKTQNVTTMFYLFSSTEFNKDISYWDTTNVTSMRAMFNSNPYFNQNINTKQVTRSDGSVYTAWDTSSVTDMKDMFYHANAFNQKIGDWDVSKVENMENMFRSATSLSDGELYKWDVSSLKNATNMFRACVYNERLQSIAKQWNNSSTYNKHEIVLYNGDLYKSLQDNQDKQPDNPNNSAFWSKLAEWDDSGQTTYGENAIVYRNDNVYISSHPQNTEDPENSVFWKEQSDLNELLKGWDNSFNPDSENIIVKEMFSHMHHFNKPLDKLNMKGITSLNRMFAHNSKFNQDLRNWDTSDVTDIQYLFYDASSFNSPVFTNTSNITNMSYVFSSANEFNQLLPWNTSSVTDMRHMFNHAEKFNQELDWDVSRVSHFQCMFKNAHAFDQDLTNWTKNSEVSVSNVSLSSSTSNRKIFVQNTHRDDNGKRRYVIIERSSLGNNETQFITTVYENEIVRQTHTLQVSNDDTYSNMDGLSVSFQINNNAFAWTNDISNTETNTNINNALDNNYDFIFIHYGKRTDMHILTDYDVWEKYKTFSSKKIVYEPTSSKYYRALKTTTSTQTFNNDPTEWVEFTPLMDSVREDILSTHSDSVDNTWVKYSGMVRHHTSYFILFRSTKYLYNFFVSGSFTNMESSKLSLKQHNNPFLNAHSNLYFGKYIGNITENILSINSYRASGSQSREGKVYFMEQKLNSICSIFENCLIAFSSRYRLPFYSSSVPLNTLVRDQNDANTIKLVVADNVNNGTTKMVNAEYVFEDYSVIGERCIFENKMYESNKDIIIFPDNVSFTDNNLWEVSTSLPSSSTLWSINDLKYATNTIVKHEASNKHYRASVELKKNIKITDARWVEVLNWSATSSYSVGDFVIHSSKVYKSSAATSGTTENPNTEPPLTNATWEEITNIQIWDAIIYSMQNNNQKAWYKRTFDGVDKYFSPKIDIRPSIFDPNNSDSWTEINVLDNNDKFDLERYCSIFYIWPSNGHWAEFSLISTHSPSYDTIANSTSEQSTEHIANKSAQDLINWRNFCNQLPDDPKITFYKNGSSVLLGSLDNNPNSNNVHNVQFLQFTSLSVSNGGSVNRFININSETSKILMLTSNFSEDNVHKEKKNIIYPDSNFQLQFYGDNAYLFGSRDSKLNVFLLFDIVKDDKLQSSVVSLYNNFDISSTAVANQVDMVLSKHEIMDPDIYVLEDNKVTYHQMKSYNVYNASDMRGMFENARNFSNAFDGLKYYIVKYSDVYASTETYATGDVVQFNGEFYESQQDNNNNNTPGLGLGFWSVFTGEKFDEITFESNVSELSYHPVGDSTQISIYSELNDENKLWISQDGGVTKLQRVPNIVKNPYGGISHFFTPSAIYMSDMFKGTTKLFVDLSNWEVSNVDDNADFKNPNNHITPPTFNIVNRTSRENVLEAMFHLFTEPTQYETTYGHVSDWILSSSITDLSELTNIVTLRSAVDQSLSDQFTDSHIQSNIEAFNESLSEWDVSHVLNFSNMLKGLESFTNGVSDQTKNRLSDRWSVKPGANLNAMFEGCESYLDNITNFYPSSFWTNVSKDAPFVYFVPDDVKNIQLSVNDTPEGNFKISWENGNYYPQPVEIDGENKSKMKYEYIIYTESGVDGNGDPVYQTSSAITPTTEAIITLEQGEYKIVVKAFSVITHENKEKTSDATDGTTVFVSIDAKSNIESSTLVIEMATNFTNVQSDTNTNVQYKWIRETTETTTNGVMTKTLNETKAHQLDENGNTTNTIDNAYGFSIDFASGNAMSYVKLENNSIKLITDGNSFNAAKKDVDTLTGTEMNDLLKYDTAVYQNGNTNYVLLKDNKTLSLYDNSSDHTTYIKRNVNIPSHYSIDGNGSPQSATGANIHALSSLKNISISQTHLSVVAVYNAVHVLYVFPYDDSSIVDSSGNFFHMMNIQLGQLSILQNVNTFNDEIKSKLVILNTNNQIFEYENISTSTIISKEWLPNGSNGLVTDQFNINNSSYDILTIHFSNADTIVVGTMKNGPYSISLD